MAHGKPSIQTEGRLARLQSAYGNQGMLRLINGGILQGKLAINQPGDAYEQEADRVADAVMRMPDPTGEWEPVNPIASTATVQRACACGGSGGGVGECEGCRAKSLELQRSMAAAS